jgi:hypothetical protein
MQTRGRRRDPRRTLAPDPHGDCFVRAVEDLDFLRMDCGQESTEEKPMIGLIAVLALTCWLIKRPMRPDSFDGSNLD